MKKDSLDETDIVKNVVVKYLESILNIFDATLLQVIVNCFKEKNNNLLVSLLESRHISEIKKLVSLQEKDNILQDEDERSGILGDDMLKLTIKPIPKTLYGERKSFEHNNPTECISFEEELTIGNNTEVSESVENKIAHVRKVLSKNKIVILQGNTGCGKSTKIPQMLLGDYSNIVVTQPRRIAAISIAKRVAKQMNVPLGSDVGFTVRFEDNTSQCTKLRYVTDGILLKELISSKCLISKTNSKKLPKSDIKRMSYDLIIIDEAHERTMNIDILLGYLKVALNKSQTKLLIMSATLDRSKLSSYFKCPTITIAHKIFPIKEQYLKTPPKDNFKAVIETVVKIVTENSRGNILVFMTGQEEINRAAEMCKKLFFGLNITVMKLYASLPLDEQELVFQRYDRKIIFSTNIAETSITIDDIKFVVDSGLVKCKSRTIDTSLDHLDIVRISKSQAQQRAGRSGRTGPGTVYRVYTRIDFENMEQNSTPEIMRSDLNDLVLTLKCMGIHDVLGFDFIDVPDGKFLKGAMDYLYYIRALDGKGRITNRGRRISHLPVSPNMGAVLLRAESLGCLEMACIVASFLESLPIFEELPSDHPSYREKHDVKSKFGHHCGDIFSYINIYQAWERSGFKTGFLREHFLRIRNMFQIRHTKNQLMRIFHCRNKDKCDKIEEALCAGFFMNVAKRINKTGYITLYGDISCQIHPSDILCKSLPEYILFYELICINREYMRVCIEITEEVLRDECNNFYDFNLGHKDSDPQNDDN